MSVHKKLMQARIKLQSVKLKKTGVNKFAGYSYFELSDFIPETLRIFDELDLCGYISYGVETATLTIIDTEDNSTMTIESPMSTCALKGTHAVQNLGAVQTYLRRYLWVTAMEILEHDALDSSEPEKPSQPAKKPVKKEEVKPLDLMQDAKFTANIPAYKGLISSGKYSADTLIQFLSTKVILTEDQKQAIGEWSEDGDIPQ